MRRFPIAPELLDVLACPACESHPGLDLVEDGEALVCPTCKRRYEIDENGIPDLDVPENLVAEA